MILNLKERKPIVITEEFYIYRREFRWFQESLGKGLSALIPDEPFVDLFSER